MKTITHAFIAGLLFAAGAAFCAENDEADRLRDEIRDLNQEIQSYRTADRLQLRHDQMRELLPLVREARDTAERHAEEWRRVLEKQKVAFTAFKAEDLRDAGFSAEVEKRASEAEHEGREVKKKFYDRINELEKKAEAVLNEPQRQELRGRWRQSEGSDAHRQELDQIRRDLEEIHHEHYGSIGPIGRFLVSSSAENLLENRLVVAEKSDTPEAKNPERTDVSRTVRRLEKEVGELRSDINLLNLLNGLHLSAQQDSQLAGVLKETGDEDRELRKDKAQKYVKALTRMRDYLAANKPVPPSVSREVDALQKEFTMNASRKSPSSQKQCLKTQVEKTEKILTEAQKSVLADYKPCLIPPKNLKDPVRIGQANDTSAEARTLERIRSVPENRFGQDSAAIVEKTLSDYESHTGRFKGTEREAKKKWLTGFLADVRKMPDADFQMNKAELATRLQTLNKEEELRKRLGELTGGKESAICQKIAQHLLNPRIIPLLDPRRGEKTDGSKIM
jgi:hypothetical protein